jgi:hypothetical protein
MTPKSWDTSAAVDATLPISQTHGRAVPHFKGTAMRRMVNVLALALVLLVVGGLVLPAIARARDAAAPTQCSNNLKQVALSVQAYHDTYGSRFPAGTLPNEELPPERRMSWLVATVPFREQQQVYGSGGPEEATHERLLFRCPSNPASEAPGTPYLTHYVGIAGVGPDATTSPLGYPGTGFFGYDRKTTLVDLQDGVGTTLLGLETTRENGPWRAGGHPTVRVLDPAAGPYLGNGGPFAANRHPLLNAAFADGSVRGLRDSVAPAVLEVLATVAGGEEVGRVGEE